MEITTSYKVKIINQKTMLNETVKIYRDALSLIIQIINKEWVNLVEIKSIKYKYSFIESLIHETKFNPNPKYKEFDLRFYKFPTYLRRAAIAKAYGIVSSYRSNLDNWEKKKLGNRPRLQIKHIVYPCLYYKNMFKIDGYKAKIKVYYKKDWVWVNVKLRKSDIDYINKHKFNIKPSAPTVEKSHNRYYLRFSFDEQVNLVSNDSINKVLAVDLGLGTDATCSVLDMRGTVLNRKFINFPREKDLLYRNLNRIKAKQSLGSRKLNRMWRLVKNENMDLTSKIANEIISFAIENKVDVIVFEHLDFNGKKKISKKQKVHHWKHKALIDIVTNKAHLLKMRVSTVNAKNTSTLAFDGSGKVKRGHEISKTTPHCIAKFTTGKIYNVDLSASYNIGARYIIRYKLKALPEKERSLVEVKVPLLKARTLCTLSTLVDMVNVLDSLVAA